VEDAMANNPQWTTIGTFNNAARMTNAEFPGTAKESFVPIYFSPDGHEGKQVAAIDDSGGTNRRNQVRVATLSIDLAVQTAFYEDFVQGKFSYDKIIDNDWTGFNLIVMDTLTEGVGGDTVDAVISESQGPQKTEYDLPSANWIMGIDYAPDGTEKQLTASMSMSLKVGKDNLAFEDKTLVTEWTQDQNEPTQAEKDQWVQDIIDEVPPVNHRWWYFAHVSWTVAGSTFSTFTENALQEIRITDGEGFQITDPDSGEAASYLRLQSVKRTTTNAQREQPVQAANAGSQPAPIFSFAFSPSSAGHPTIDPDPVEPSDNTFQEDDIYTAHKIDFAFVDLRMGFYVFRITKSQSETLISPDHYPNNPNITEKWYVRFDGVTTEVDPVGLPETIRDDDTDSDSLNSTFLSMVDGRAFILQAVGDFLILPNGTTVFNIDNVVTPTGDQDESTDPFMFIFNNSIFLPPLGATHPQGGAIYVHIHDSTITWINDDDVDTLLAEIGTTNPAAWNGHLAYVGKVG
jgi:hypothetical protein